MEISERWFQGIESSRDKKELILLVIGIDKDKEYLTFVKVKCLNLYIYGVSF